MKLPVKTETFIINPGRFFHSCWVVAESEDQTSPYSRVLSAFGAIFQQKFYYT